MDCSFLPIEFGTQIMFTILVCVFCLLFAQEALAFSKLFVQIQRIQIFEWSNFDSGMIRTFFCDGKPQINKIWTKLFDWLKFNICLKICERHKFFSIVGRYMCLNSSIDFFVLYRKVNVNFWKMKNWKSCSQFLFTKG